MKCTNCDYPAVEATAKRCPRCGSHRHLISNAEAAQASKPNVTTAKKTAAKKASGKSTPLATAPAEMPPAPVKAKAPAKAATTSTT